MGGSWRAFALGARWGIGHSTGLILMTAVFFLFDVDLDRWAPYCEALVGVFMIGLGLASAYRALHPPAGASPTETELQRLNPGSEEEDEEEEAAVVMGGSGRAGGREGRRSGSKHTAVPPPFAPHAHGPRSIHNPQLQRAAAFGIGVVHGVAGPGGVLGVLPAVELHDGGLATIYLGSFCATSIVIMGGFAALTGEATHRLAGRSGARLLHGMRMVSAALSVVVGLLWLVLLWFGVLDEVFP